MRCGSGWRDDLQDPSWSIAGIPEGMRLVPRLEDEVARVSEQHLVTQKRPDAPFENVAVLVLARVPMLALTAPVNAPRS